MLLLYVVAIDCLLRLFGLAFLCVSSPVGEMWRNDTAYVRTGTYMLVCLFVCPRVVTRVLVWGCGGAENLSVCVCVCLFVQG